MGCKRKTDLAEDDSLTCKDLRARRSIDEEPAVKKKSSRSDSKLINSTRRTCPYQNTEDLFDFVAYGEFAEAESLLSSMGADEAYWAVHHRISEYSVTLLLATAYSSSPRLPHSFLMKIVMAGGDTHAVDSDGNSFLHLLIRRERSEDLKSLLEAVDCPIHPQLLSLVNCRNDERRTPLHVAILGEDIVAIEALLKAGADVNARSSTGFTAFHFAALASNPEKIMQLLLTCNDADVNAVSIGGKTVLDMVCENENNERVISLLVDHGARCLYDPTEESEFETEDSDDEWEDNFSDCDGDSVCGFRRNVNAGC